MIQFLDEPRKWCNERNVSWYRGDEVGYSNYYSYRLSLIAGRNKRRKMQSGILLFVSFLSVKINIIEKIFFSYLISVRRGIATKKGNAILTLKVYIPKWWYNNFSNISYTLKEFFPRKRYKKRKGNAYIN